MPQATILLLDQARAAREKAKRARRLADEFDADDVAGRLRDYARQLEAVACQFEERAASFRPAAERPPGPGAVTVDRTTAGSLTSK